MQLSGTVSAGKQAAPEFLNPSLGAAQDGCCHTPLVSGIIPTPRLPSCFLSQSVEQTIRVAVNSCWLPPRRGCVSLVGELIAARVFTRGCGPPSPRARALRCGCRCPRAIPSLSAHPKFIPAVSYKCMVPIARWIWLSVIGAPNSGSPTSLCLFIHDLPLHPKTSPDPGPQSHYPDMKPSSSSVA